MNDNNKLPKQAKPQEFELIELLFREYIRSHIVRPNIEYSFQARFQSFIDQIPSYLHSVGKTGFFTYFFFGSFASLLDTKLSDKLGIKKLHFNFDRINNLRIVAEADDKTHVFIFTENNKNKNIGFTKGEWQRLKGIKYTDDDNKKLEINIININKSTGSITVEVEKQDIQNNGDDTKEYKEITKQFVDKNEQYVYLEEQISLLSDVDIRKINVPLQDILRYIKKIHDHYQGLPYGDGAREANHHALIASIFNHCRYGKNTHVYLEQLAGKGYADIVLLVRGRDRATHSIPIIIELKADEGFGATPNDGLRQAEEYTEGFQPNNMRILSLADNILCVGMNLDSPAGSFMQIKVVERDQEVVPLIQSIVDSVGKISTSNQAVIKQEIQSNLEKTHNTFPGTGEKSSAHYFSRFILAESLVLRGYDKHIFVYDKNAQIPTKTVIDNHNTRASKKMKTEKIVDPSNAVTTILFISTSSADAAAILVNIVDVNRDVVVHNINLDESLMGNRQIVQLNIQFNIDKYQESFEEYCKINLLKIYGSISEYNQVSIALNGRLLVNADMSEELFDKLHETISSHDGLVVTENQYKELFGKIGEIVYPIKSLIGRESEFQGLLEGIFKYYSDTKLAEGSENRELVLTEFQTGGGGRIDMLVQAIGPSNYGMKEYTPIGLELKYDNGIKLSARTIKRQQDKKIQKLLLTFKEQSVVKNLLDEQMDRYAKGAAIKSITDGNKIGIMGIVFNGQAQESSKLLLTTNKFLEVDMVHSSKLYTISHGVGIPNSNDLPPPDDALFIPDWVPQEVIDTSARMRGEDRGLLDLSNRNLNNDKLDQYKGYAKSSHAIDLSFNEITGNGLKGLIRYPQEYINLSDNDLGQEYFEDVLEVIEANSPSILKLSDIGMNAYQMRRLIETLLAIDTVSHLEIQRLEDLINNTQINHLRDLLFKYFQDTHTLEYLDLSFSPLTQSILFDIAVGLVTQNTLKTLILQHCNILPISAVTFKVGLQESDLTYVDFSGNPLGIEGFKYIVDGLTKPSDNAMVRRETQRYSKVEIIKLSNIGIKYDRDDRENVELLTSAIQDLLINPRFISIDISYNNLGTGLLSQIFNILSKAGDEHSLRDFILSGNKIDLGSHQATINSLKGSIKEFFEQNKRVRSLGMADMHLDDELGVEIAKGVEKNGALIHLDLSGNTNLDIKTISALASTLRTHQYLKYLNLSDIKLNIKNIKILFGAVQVNNDLTHLDVSHNDLSEIFIESNGNRILDLDHQYVDFQSLLKCNTSLKYLNLSHCKLTTNSLKSLFAFLKENSNVEVLDIRGNRLDDAIVDYIVAVLIENAAQGLNGLNQLYMDKSHLSDDSVRKLVNKSLGISVVIDGNTSSDTDGSDALQRECIIEPIDKKLSYPWLTRLPLTLEDATSRNINDYELRQLDIIDVARVHYGITDLEIVGSEVRLSHVLENYRHSGNINPFTIILHVESAVNTNQGDKDGHWVSLVIHRMNNEYSGYYIDSLSNAIDPRIAAILDSRHIRIHDMSIAQQTDWYNCGLWALENANTIRNALKAGGNVEGINLPNISLEGFAALRRTITQELHQDAQRTELLNNIGVQRDMVIPIDYSNNIVQYRHASLVLADCIKAMAMLHISNNNPKHKRSVVNEKLKITGQEFLKCTHHMKQDITYFELMMLLLQFQILDDNNCNQVNQFVSRQESIDEIKQYKALGTNVNSLVKEEGLSLILLAGRMHNIHLFKFICAKYHNQLSDIDHSGQTILHKVVFFPDPNKWVEFLINQKIKINIRDEHGNTALNYAIERELYKVPKLLIQHGADGNNINNDGKTSLHYAFLYNRGRHLFNIVKLLISNGAKVNIQDKDGNTALDYAYQFANKDVLHYLIVHGAHKGIELNDKSDISITENIKASEIHIQDIPFDWQGISSTELPTTIETYIFPKASNKPAWLHIRYGNGGELRKKRANLNTKDHNQAEKHHVTDGVFEESKLTTPVLEDCNHHKHRHHHGEGHERAKHHINKKHNVKHHRGRRDTEDKIKISNTDSNQEESLFSDNNNNAKFMYSSASRLEFALTSIIKSIWSKMIEGLKYPNAHAPDKIVQSAPNVDFDIPRLGIYNTPFNNTESHHNHSGSNNDYEYSTPLPSSTENQDINCGPLWDRDTQEYRLDAMTCTFTHGHATVVSNIHQESNSIQSENYYIPSDTYENCRIVNYDSSPSMHCEGNHTNMIYNLNGLFSLSAALTQGTVIVIVIKALGNIVNFFLGPKKPDVDNNSELDIDIFTISPHKRKEWGSRIEHIVTLIEIFKSQDLSSKEHQKILYAFEDSLAKYRTKIEVLGQKSSAENIIDITESLKTLQEHIEDAIDPNPQQPELHQKNIQQCNARDTEAALPLAECLRKGYGTNKDDFLADLTLAIGVELGDQESVKLMATTSVSHHIRDIARKCLPEIAEHKLGVEGREILWDEIMSRGKAFTYFVEKVTQHSYYQTIQESQAAGIKYWSNFVEPVYYCLSEIAEEVSIVGDSLNQ